jgi:hypothetical protein
MSGFKNELNELLSADIEDGTLDEFRKMISFIDSTLANAYKLSGDERAQFLVTNLLNMRGYMSSEVVSHSVRKEVNEKVIQLHDSLFDSNGKKKEEELKAEQPLPENLSETDLSML